MGGRGLIDRITFAGGEMGEKLVARADTAKYQVALEKAGKFRHAGRRRRHPRAGHALRAGSEEQRSARPAAAVPGGVRTIITCWSSMAA
jgi:hypothetical protein